MLEHVLHDEVSEGVAAKLWSTRKHLLDKWSCLLSRAMLQETLEYSATIAVTCCSNCVPEHLGQDEVKAVWRNELDAFLKDMISVG
mmetsp:Transcript_49885/g.118947  ORF Transcript_49885/g.118947 Transcript_49885/m.118947 type:complete len:86 (-) Transcript_49885:1435-1692(-)